MLREAFEEAKRRARNTNNKYRNWQRRYFHRPDLFAAECITWKKGDGPTEYQKGILLDVVNEGRVACRGPHGLGKTALSSWLILWFALTRDGQHDWKVPTTASVWRQLTRYTWPELHKWAGRLRWDKIGREPFKPQQELMTLSLKLTTGSAFALAAEDETAIEGAHADQLLYVFDEAKAIKDGIFDAAEGAFSGATDVEGGVQAFALAISTPGEPQGRFYDIHQRKPGYDDWKAIHVTVEQAIKAGRVARKWVENRRDQWGEESPVFINRVLGNFVSDETVSVIPLSWIEAAIERHKDWQEKGRIGKLSALGVDVGRGGNKSVIAEILNVLVVSGLRKYQDRSTMPIVGRVVGILRGSPGIDVTVDVIGVGAGVVDKLREDGHPVIAFNAGAAAVDSWTGDDITDRSGELMFSDWRSAAWWLVREMLDPAYAPTLALPDDDDLLGELVAPSYTVMSRGRIKVESKEDVSKRLGAGRSTDVADAVIMGLIGNLVGGVVVTGIVAQGKTKGWGGGHGRTS